MALVFGMLNDAARAELNGELRRLAKRVSELHKACAALPRGQKKGVAVLVSARDWEPRAFAALRRQRSEDPVDGP